MKKNKGGRPTANPGEKATRMSLSVAPSLLAHVEARAKATGVSASAYVGILIRADMTGTASSAPLEQRVERLETRMDAVEKGQKSP